MMLLNYFTFICPADNINTLRPVVDRERFSVLTVDHRDQKPGLPMPYIRSHSKTYASDEKNYMGHVVC